jgi:hypothetical protein
MLCPALPTQPDYRGTACRASGRAADVDDVLDPAQAWIAGRPGRTITRIHELTTASLEAGAKRVRSMLMTVMTNVFGVLPILVDDEVGSDVANRIAAPMCGGRVSLTIVRLFVLPAIYVVWRFHPGPAKTPTGKLGEPR